ncbi:MAG TPA: MliC family protein [Vitreimonas sp.]|uniref:MliC family protein n=1 Tax=Vitreimonas sp. TaxID=3069702 RepID=UPI002D27D9C0|nr:MliC family protein [Vitreimonas sp.]HYD88829.1 MliC family protein [Vitreimonas sp.]
MRSVALVLALVSLAACQTPCPAAPTAPTNARFTCDDGSALQVTFTNESATVVQEGYITLQLPARVSGSGYRYADNGAELRGRGGEARWTRPGAAETVCQEVQ